MIGLNKTIFYFFYNLAHKSDTLDGLIVFFAFHLPFVVVFLAGLFLLFHYKILPSKNPFNEFIKKWKCFIYISFSSVIAWGLAVLFKNLLQYPRPVLSFDDIYPLITKTTFSFPSEHATFFMALAVAIFFYNKKVGYVFISFAIIIGLARIASGVHFPVDILGGFILGSLVACVVKIIKATSRTCG